MTTVRRAVTTTFLLALAVFGLLITGCTTTTTQSFNVRDNPEIEASYIAVDADFGKYDRLFASDMGIFFPTNAAPSIEDQQRTRQIFRKAFLAELQARRRSTCKRRSSTTAMHPALMFPRFDVNSATSPDLARLCS
jgi:hypothetical protein